MRSFAAFLIPTHSPLGAFGVGVGSPRRIARTSAVLDNPTVIPGVGVTHLSYPVRKP